MKISFVIIAYNTANYIEKCLKSVLMQPHHEQIIVIDDGSTDDTSKVISQFEDDSIQFIRHDKNLGCCYSRMEGLRLCTGDYMAFIDSDDYYVKELPIPSSDSLKPDIIEFGMFGAFNSAATPKNIISNGDYRYSSRDIFKAYEKEWIIEILVNKLFSRKIYTKVAENLDLTDLSNFCDNMCLMSSLSFFAESYQKVDESCYYYRQGSGMTTYLSKMEKIRQFCSQVEALERLEKIGIPTEKIYALIKKRAYNYYNWMVKAKEEIPLTDSDIEEAGEMVMNTFENYIPYEAENGIWYYYEEKR